MITNLKEILDYLLLQHDSKDYRKEISGNKREYQGEETKSEFSIINNRTDINKEKTEQQDQSQQFDFNVKEEATTQMHFEIKKNGVDMLEKQLMKISKIDINQYDFMNDETFLLLIDNMENILLKTYQKEIDSAQNLQSYLID